jgi:4'-phosphopantetheinyl transferase EntD
MQTGAVPDTIPSDDCATILDALFPAGVRTVLSVHVAATATLQPAERQAAEHFATVRREEFRHGRDCARRALARLGAGPADIPVGANREPLWPPGVTGSISHAGTAAAAAVALKRDVLSLGLDLEPESPLEEALIASICLPAEIARELAGSERPGETARLIFSAKEAAYKALWPIAREFLDFHDLELRIDRETSRFMVVSRTAKCPSSLAGRIEGRFTCVNGLFATAATVLPEA